jgi:hypothetical protein
MTSDVAAVVTSIVRDGLGRYAAAVRAYWPAVGDVDAAESSMVVRRDGVFKVFDRNGMPQVPSERAMLRALQLPEVVEEREP